MNTIVFVYIYIYIYICILWYVQNFRITLSSAYIVSSKKGHFCRQVSSEKICDKQTITRLVMT